MKCAKCPLFESWNNENDRGESCVIFEDSWDSPFQYEDKEGAVIGTPERCNFYSSTAVIGFINTIKKGGDKMEERQHNRKPHGDLIDRDELLKHPFLCGKFDRENADPHFINGCETIGEYIRLFPAIVPKERKGDDE